MGTYVFRRPLALLFAVILAAAGLADLAQADQLYISAGDGVGGPRLIAVDGGVIQFTASTQNFALPLSVRDSIWLATYSTNGPTEAQEYDLAGVPTGQVRPWDATTIQGADGATDGRVNYTMTSFGPTGTVYRADGEWQLPTAIFTAAPAGGDDFNGITFDTISQTLWLSDRNNIYNYTLTGTLLGQFAHGNSRGSLAYEPSSDTLWHVQNSSDQLQQYSKAGALLQTVNVPGLSGNNWGAEFAMPPTRCTVRATAVPTITLQNLTQPTSFFGNVAYHPGFNQYYSGVLGTNTYPIQVWDAAGNLLQTQAPSNYPWRGFHFNANTGNVEATTYNAAAGDGLSTGLFALGLDGAGLYLEPNTPVTFPLPGIGDSQPCPTYDEVRDVLYSQRDGNGTVEVISHATGALSSTIVLDLGTAGTTAAGIQGDVIGYDPRAEWLITIEEAGNRALVFDLSGAFVGACSLPVVPGGGRFDIGYANGQLFIHQQGTTDYRAFQIIKCGCRVLVLGGDSLADVQDVQSKIAATGLVRGQVVYYPPTGPTPTLGTLQAYDAVFLWTDGDNAFNLTALGNAMADYVDGGGGVVLGTFANASIALGGRFLADSYHPIAPAGQSAGGALTLGTVVLPAHPVMCGVYTFNGGNSWRSTGGTVFANGSFEIARWSNGQTLVAERPGLAGRVLSLNFLPPSTDSGTNGGFWDPTTDGDVLMANALGYAGDCLGLQLCGPLDQTLPCAGTAGTPLTLDFLVHEPEGLQVTVTIQVDGNPEQVSVVAAGAPPTSATVSFPFLYPGGGTYVVDVSAVSASGQTASHTLTVVITDATAPTLSASLLRPMLWPARNGMLPVGLSATASDNCDPNPSISVEIWSDEANGAAPFSPDASGAGTAASLALRAERAYPMGDGRVYLVVLRATDSAGNASTATCLTSIVPIVPVGASILNVVAQAAAAQAFCLANSGAAPASFTLLHAFTIP